MPRKALTCTVELDVYQVRDRTMDCSFNTRNVPGSFTCSLQNEIYLVHCVFYSQVHIVFFHVKEFCNISRKGLGYFSEQASESVHYDFNAWWEKFKVHSTHPDFGSRLLNAVSRYNAQHL